MLERFKKIINPEESPEEEKEKPSPKPAMIIDVDPPQEMFPEENTNYDTDK